MRFLIIVGFIICGVPILAQNFDMKKVTSTQKYCDKEICTEYNLTYPLIKIKKDKKLEKNINESFNQLISSFNTKIIKDLKNNNICHYDGVEYYLNLTMEVFSDTNKTYTIKTLEEGYDGSVDNNPYLVKYFNYSKRTGKKILLDNLFIKGYDEKLKSILLRYLRKSLKIPIEDSFPYADYYKFYIPKNFIITNKYIIFSYPIGSIMNYTAGIIEVKIPYLALNDILKKEYKHNSTISKIEVPKMLVIKKGSFMMGCERNISDCAKNELPLHKVTIDYPFEIAMEYISIKEYMKFVNATKSNYLDFKQMITWSEPEKPSLEELKEDIFPNENSEQVIAGITWNNAQAYIKWLNKKTGKEYRLPTESELKYIQIRKNKYYNKLYFGTELVEDSYADTYKNTPRDGSPYKNKTDKKVLCGRVIDCGNGCDYERGLISQDESYWETHFRIARTLNKREGK